MAITVGPTGAMRQAGAPSPTASPEKPRQRSRVSIGPIIGGNMLGGRALPMPTTRRSVNAPIPASNGIPQLGITREEATRVRAGEHGTDLALAERLTLSSAVDRHRHRAAAIKTLGGRDPGVVRRWFTAEQRTNPDFMVVLDAVLDGDDDALARATEISKTAKPIGTPWGVLPIIQAAQRASAALSMRSLGPVVPEVVALMGRRLR